MESSSDSENDSDKEARITCCETMSTVLISMHLASFMCYLVSDNRVC